MENHSLCQTSWQAIIFLVLTGCPHAGPMCTAMLPGSWCCVGISKIARSQQGAVINLLCMCLSLLSNCHPENKRSPLSFFYFLNTVFVPHHRSFPCANNGSSSQDLFWNHTAVTNKNHIMYFAQMLFCNSPFSFMGLLFLHGKPCFSTPCTALERHFKAKAGYFAKYVFFFFSKLERGSM